MFDPALLEPIVTELLAAVPPFSAAPRSGLIPEELVRTLVAADGSALRALPQIVAAAAAGARQAKWRLHLQFQVHQQAPLRAVLTEDEVGGDADERSVLAGALQSGVTYLLDRGYERYRLFERIVQTRSDYVCRIQRRPVEIVQEREFSPAARAAGIVSDQIVRLGRSRRGVGQVTHTVRRIVVRTGASGQGRPRTDRKASEEIVLLTNLIDVPAEVIAAVYELRWSIELFFRFLKHVLGCRHLLSHKPEGIAIQVYCALIAALLLSLAAGGSVGRRGFELVCLYLQGWAEEEELLAGLQRLRRSPPTSR